MTPSVYETGPLKGLPLRGPLPRVTLARPVAVEDLPESLQHRVTRPPLRRQAMTNSWPCVGDPALNDQLDIPGIPADAPPPPIEVTDARPFRSATPVIVIIIACTVLIFAVRMLGLPS